MSELTSLRNIGEEMDKKLKSVDIATAEELMELGSKEAFFRLKMHYPNICLVHLYALEGAILGIDYNHLPENVRQALQEFSDSFNSKKRIGKSVK